ncbi:MAG TPA: hypothetical protein VG937_29105 [Polyangiaceae bacterium]|nr:hypothetical protein [Polyangiaceae bacterium]
MSHPIYASISRSIPLRPSARATLLAFSLAAGLALPLLVSCAGGSTSSSEVSTRNELKVEGTLLYEEQVGGVHVGFWETPSGLLGITQASVDGPELSKRIAESVKQPTLSEAYRALRAVAGGGAISVPKALSDADARYPLARAETSFDTPERLPGAATTMPSEGATSAPGVNPRARASGDVGVLSQPVTWAEDDAAVGTWLCVSSQTCQIGFGSIYSGWIQNKSSYRVQLFNNSYDTPAAYGSRYRVSNRQTWVTSMSGRLQPRYVVEGTYYGGVGIFARDSYISGWEPNPITPTSTSVTFDQTKPLGPGMRVSMAQSWADPSLKAFVGGSPQTHSFCVKDVPTAFSSFPFHPSGKVRYRSQGGSTLAPFNAKLNLFGSGSNVLGICGDLKATWKNHIQGVGRLRTTNNDNRWFVMSRATPGTVGGSGIFLAQFADDAIGNPEGRLVAAGADYSGEPPSNRRTWYYYPIPDTDHPGGFQVVGGLLAIASEGAGSAPGIVDFYDLRVPGSKTAWFQRLLLDGTHGEPTGGNNGKPSGAGLVKLANGLYLLFVLNKDDQYSGRFYLSSSATLDVNTRWQWLSDASWSGRKYQNANFITDCNGTLYLAMTNNENYEGYCDFSGCVLNAGTNTADLYGVAFQSGTFNIQLGLKRSMNFGIDDDGYDQFRAAANFYVGRDNKLLLYSHAHHANTDIWGCPDSKLKLSEFAY